MFEILSSYMSHIQYAAPPLLGAFIGYLTNKIAIKMLFRPLNKWRILGVGVPMTPGVIPSKRHQLAQNIGEMVGGHLLTSREIGHALEKKAFQDQLEGLVKNRIGGLLKQDLPSLPELIPPRYTSYFDIGKKTIIYQVKTSLHTFVNSSEFEGLVRRTTKLSLDELLSRDIDSFIHRSRRDELYALGDEWIGKMLNSQAMENWVEDFVFSKLHGVVHKEESLQQILPETISQIILQTVELRTPDLLAKLSQILKDPDIQQKIVEGVKKGVDSFVVSMGPMGGMVQNFLNLETIEKVVKDYFKENEDDIEQWLSDKAVQKKVAQALLERVRHYLNVPIADLFSQSDLNIAKLGSNISEQIIKLLREDTVAELVGSFLKENIETYIGAGSKDLKDILFDINGGNGKGRVEDFVSNQATSLIRSEKSRVALADMVENVIESFMQKPIGKLTDILPAGVRDGLYNTIRKMSSDMLAVEVPGLVDSLNIKRVVADKIDTLDLLKLEELLLSIMEEQFKYINLFGALLGFLIGCLNVILLVAIR